MHCVKKNGARPLRQVTYAFLSNAVLVMRTNTTKCDGLIHACNLGSEASIIEPSIVGVVGLDIDAVAVCECFISFLGSNGGLHSLIFLQVDISTV